MENDDFSLLKKDIRTKFGKEVLHGKDWIQLAELISKDTQRHISVSTLKRFFGIIKSPFHPSKYTLETLVRFMGFEDLHDYQNYYDDTEFIKPDGETWEILKNRIKKITQTSLLSLKEKTGYNNHPVLIRDFAVNKLDLFTEAHETAAVYTAPDGYGKSTTLIQLAEYILDPENTRYSNDILLLIDGSIFFHLYSQSSNYELLDQFLEYKAASSIGFFFNRNPEKRKGRFIIMIDDIDEIYCERERYFQLMENLMRMITGTDSRWHKIICTCKPENLDVIYQLHSKNPLFRTYWFKLSTDDVNLNKNRNIPSLSKEEIENALRQSGFNSYLTENNAILARLLEVPPFMYLLTRQLHNHRTITAVDLLRRYIYATLCSGAFRDEKAAIINSYIDLCNWGKETEVVEKIMLTNSINFCNTAYRMMIAHGILHEMEVNEGMLGSNIYVGFSIKPVFAYLLLDKWQKSDNTNGYLMQKIRMYYSNNIKLRNLITELFMEIADQEHQTEPISQLKLTFEEVPPVLEADKQNMKT